MGMGIISKYVTREGGSGKNDGRAKDKGIISSRRDPDTVYPFKSEVRQQAVSGLMQETTTFIPYLEHPHSLSSA
jgi:hypothetical protein